MKKCDFKHPPGDEIYRSGTPPCLRLMGRRTRFLDRTFVTWQSYFLIIRHFTTMLICSCSMSGANVMIDAVTWRNIRRSLVIWLAFSLSLRTREKGMESS